jgi:hypothetical protein
MHDSECACAGESPSIRVHGRSGFALSYSERPLTAMQFGEAVDSKLPQPLAPTAFCAVPVPLIAMQVGERKPNETSQEPIPDPPLEALPMSEMATQFGLAIPPPRHEESPLPPFLAFPKPLTAMQLRRRS